MTEIPYLKSIHTMLGVEGAFDDGRDWHKIGLRLKKLIGREPDGHMSISGITFVRAYNTTGLHPDVIERAKTFLNVRGINYHVKETTLVSYYPTKAGEDLSPITINIPSKEE